MRIDRLTLQNFRRFENENWEFGPGFNVFIGNNGTGKTAALDAIAITLGAFVAGFRGYKFRSIEQTDVRLISSGTEDQPTLEPVTPVEVGAEGEIDGENIKWMRWYRPEATTPRSGKTKVLRAIAENLEQRLADDAILPLIAYYPTGRLWEKSLPEAVQATLFDDIALDTDEEETETRDSINSESRLSGYRSCLFAQANEPSVRRWMRLLELSALQRRKSNPTLEAVKTCVASSLEDWTEFRYDILLKDLVVQNPKGVIMLTRLLSHGQRSMLSMITDMAYRCARLNPKLRDKAVNETPGVVLIDELDLHLHPKWQRRIIDDLRRTFPKVQFFVATHSPIILQNLSSETDKVIDFSGEEWSLTESSTPNDILKRMGVEIPQQDLDWLDMFHAAQEYYRVLEEAKATGREDSRLPVLRARLDELMIPFEKNPAFAAFLEVKRAVAGIDVNTNGTGKTK